MPPQPLKSIYSKVADKADPAGRPSVEAGHDRERAILSPLRNAFGIGVVRQIDQRAAGHIGARRLADLGAFIEQGGRSSSGWSSGAAGCIGAPRSALR